MTLLGKWNWYLPSWLEWLPDVHVEGAEPRRRESAGQCTPNPVPALHRGEVEPAAVAIGGGPALDDLLRDLAWNWMPQARKSPSR